MSRFGPGTMMALIFAILIGLGGAYVVRQYMKPKPDDSVAPVQAVPQPITVPVAADDLKPGRTIMLNDIILMKFKDEETLRKHPFGKQAFMGTVDQIIGRMVKMEIKKNGVFLTDRFYADGTGPGVENNVADGAVARALPITSGADILQFVTPGSMVDVLFRTRPPRDPQTVTLLEGVKVLAVGRAVTENQQQNTTSREASLIQAPSVTVELSPYQAKWIAQVEGLGDLQIVLRNRNKKLADGSGSAARLSMQQLIRMPVGEKKKEITVFLGARQQNVVFDQRTIYNDDLLIPIPVPPKPPAPSTKKVGM